MEDDTQLMLLLIASCCPDRSCFCLVWGNYVTSGCSIILDGKKLKYFNFGQQSHLSLLLTWYSLLASPNFTILFWSTELISSMPTFCLKTTQKPISEVSDYTLLVFYSLGTLSRTALLHGHLSTNIIPHRDIYIYPLIPLTVYLHGPINSSFKKLLHHSLIISTKMLPI